MSISQKPCKPPTDPVYKPTPISILEKRTNNTTDHLNVEYSKSLDYPRSVFEETIPIYQPTPISELERYAPNSLSDYGLTNGPITQDQPSYSPVVKIKSLRAPSVPFLYQPSSALSQSSAFSYTSEIIDIKLDSDGDDAVPVVTKSESDVSVKPMACDIQNLQDNQLTNHQLPVRKRKLKRKINYSKSKETNVADVERSTGTNDKRSSDGSNKDHDGDGDDDDDDDDKSTLAKRQKILSLYQDLYGDTDNNNLDDKNMTKNSVKSSPLIPPYMGPLIKKPDTANTDKKCDSSSVSGSVQIENIVRPRVPLRKSDKIPMPIRTRYLDQFIEECLVIYDCPSDAYKRALEDEQSCHDKATSRMAYLNAVIQQLKSLKAEKTSVQLGEKRKLSSNTTTRPSSSSTLNSRSADSNNKKDDAEEKLDRLVRGPLLYNQLTTYLLSEEDLQTNGYPPNERVCCRCGTRFLVDEFGHSLTKGECIYHWGKAVKQKSFGRGIDLRYLCCNGDIGQPGCQICPKGHVHDANKWLDNEGFVVTLPPLPKSPICEDDEDACNNVYALDCEMVYTTGGCELARITIVNSKLQTVLDEVVCPDNPVIDCNSRFSGLREEDIEKAKYHITDIQAKLLHLFDSDTILIGHSLESDLTALKLIHNKIVDTSIMFPHRLGLPNKRALRNLVSEILQQIIQQDESGHNSMEDAVACMKLVHYKVKEDLRRGKWTFS
ncbi:unnamed protein product [Trichobilharzia regenti]|nr:unnamed protein product [Trichobilharzia regenti]